MKKLSIIGINPYLLQWITDYLSDRTQFVGVNGVSTATQPVLSGVPQGSVLGPLLFLIHIDGITSIPLSDSSMLLYADDLLLYRAIRDTHDFSRLQQDINCLHHWIKENDLQFNAAKCKYMIVSRKRQPSVPATPLHINNLVMEKVAFFKYLGVWLSHNLTWNKHVGEACKVTSKQVGVIYRKFYRHSSSETLLQLYMSFIRPRLEYAAPVWDPNLQTLAYAVEKVQTFALKMCLKN